MTLGVLSEQGGSIRNLAASGQAGRFVDQYLARYAQAFERVYYFSYADESAPLPPGCVLVPNRRRMQRWAYALLLPFLEARSFRECAVLRVMQLTGEVPAILAKLAYGVPFVATYGYDYGKNARAEGAGRLRSALFRLRTRVALGFADRIIVTNPRIRADVERRIGAGRVLFIPNAVDTRAFAPPAEARAAADLPTILFVGRLSPEKNLPLVIQAAAALARPVRLRFIGSGPLAAALASQAAAAGMPLELPGVVPHEQLPDELRRADLFVLASSSEGHPKSLLEALSCGCVCVGTDVEGIRDVIRDGENGLLAPVRVEALRAAFERALGDAGLRDRLGRNARAGIVARYDIAATLAAEIEALRALAGARRGRAAGSGGSTTC